MKVLIADDCEATITILKKNLDDWGYEPLTVNDGEQALRVLRSAAGPRLALLDWTMPGLEGTKVCQILRERNESALNYTYVVMLTGREGKELMLQALEAGADDYLTKPVCPQELQLRLRAGRRIVELQQRVVATNRQLEMVATRDELTCAHNRSATMERLAIEIDRAVRSNGELAVLTVSVDGWNASDEEKPQLEAVLPQLVARLHYATRSFDIVGRLDQVTFVIVLPDATTGVASGVAERLRLYVEQQAFPIGEGDVKDVTVSIGIAESRDVGLDRKQLLSESNIANAEASSDGGNKVILRRGGNSHEPIEHTSALLV